MDDAFGNDVGPELAAAVPLDAATDSIKTSSTTANFLVFGAFGWAALETLGTDADDAAALELLDIAIVLKATGDDTQATSKG